MSKFRSNRRAPIGLLTIFLFASVALVGCDQAPSASTTSTQTPPTRSTQVSTTPTVVQTPALVKLSADVGWTEIFQQKGSVENGLTTKGSIGEFTTSKPFAIWTSCLGTGSVEISLGSEIDSKMSCTNAGATADVNKDTHPAPTTSTHYIITATITGPAQWEVLIETQD